MSDKRRRLERLEALVPEPETVEDERTLATFGAPRERADRGRGKPWRFVPV